MVSKVALTIVAYEATEGGMNYHRFSDKVHYDLDSAAAELQEAESGDSPWYGDNGEWIIQGELTYAG